MRDSFRRFRVSGFEFQVSSARQTGFSKLETRNSKLEVPVPSRMPGIVELSRLVIVQRLPEANPDIEQAKAAAEAAEETVVHHATERRE